LSSNLAFSSSTSKSYASALYELAKENAELDQIEIETNNIKQLIASSLDFKNMISDPTIDKQELKQAMNKIAEAFNFCETFKKFLNFLIFKGRLFFLNAIIDSFLKLISYKKGEIEVKFVSSKKLSSREIHLIQQDLSKDFKSKIKIKHEHDPNLIGGVIIQVGSIMIDTSIKNKLKRLKNIMISI